MHLDLPEMVLFFVQFVVKFQFTKTYLFFGKHFTYLEDPGVYTPRKIIIPKKNQPEIWRC